MKKLLSMLLFITSILISTNVFAVNGDIVGHIYSTDIRAYINGVEVQAYNTGGKTAVAIEDIIKENSNEYIYDDYYRTLKFFSLSPDYLVEKKAENKTNPGKVIGNIYETDIKTSIYDVTVPTCNIGGKTAVAIEDLGYDGAFSPIGGKFIWNEAERTIELEFLYSRWSDISRNKDITISFNEAMTEAAATFEDMKADGFSLDDKRTPVAENDIPDIIERFHNLEKENDRAKTEQSFMADKHDIADNDYDLSINKYKEVEYVPVEYNFVNRACGECVCRIQRR